VQDGVEAVDGLLDGGQVHHVDDEVLGLGVGPFQQVDTADVVPPVQQLGGAGLAGAPRSRLKWVGTCLRRDRIAARRMELS